MDNHLLQRKDNLMFRSHYPRNHRVSQAVRWISVSMKEWHTMEVCRVMQRVRRRLFKGTICPHSNQEAGVHQGTGKNWEGMRTCKMEEMMGFWMSFSKRSSHLKTWGKLRMRKAKTGKEVSLWEVKRDRPIRIREAPPRISRPCNPTIVRKKSRGVEPLISL